MIALVVGLFRPRVALVAALLAMPMATIAVLMHRSVWFQTDRFDASTVIAAIAGGAAATAALALVGHRQHRPTNAA